MYFSGLVMYAPTRFTISRRNVIHTQFCGCLFISILLLCIYKLLKEFQELDSSYIEDKEKASSHVKGCHTSAHAQTGQVKPKSRRRWGDNRWNFALRGFGPSMDDAMWPNSVSSRRAVTAHQTCKLVSEWLESEVDVCIRGISRW